MDKDHEAEDEHGEGADAWHKSYEAGTKAIAQDLDPAKRQGALSMKS